MSWPTMSVVIPAFNAAATIQRALGSALAQSYDGILEVIVVDDGSSDNTAAMVREQHRSAVLIQQENQGVGAARNAGIAAARGDCVLLLDADDEWTSIHASDVADVACRFPNVGLIGTGYSFRPDDRVEVIYSHRGREPLQADWFSIAQHMWIANMSSIGIMKTAFLDAGGFRHDMPLSEDTEFLARLCLQADFAFHPRISAVYHGGVAGSATSIHRDVPGSKMVFQALEMELNSWAGSERKRQALKCFLASLLVDHFNWCMATGHTTEAHSVLSNALLRKHPHRWRMTLTEAIGSVVPPSAMLHYHKFRQSRWGTRRYIEKDGFFRRLQKLTARPEADEA